MEVAEMELIGDATVRVDLHAHLIDSRVKEQAAVGVEELGRDDLEEFTGYTTCI